MADARRRAARILDDARGEARALVEAANEETDAYNADKHRFAEELRPQGKSRALSEFAEWGNDPRRAPMLTDALARQAEALLAAGYLRGIGIERAAIFGAMQTLAHVYADKYGKTPFDVPALAAVYGSP